MGKLSRGKLERAGFVLEKYEDGMFWVLEKSPGPDIQRLLAACCLCIANFEETSFHEIFVLQCNFNFSEPTLYIDNFLWHLSSRDFTEIVHRLAKKKLFPL